MKKSEILAFLNAHPVCYLATVDGAMPHVRGMMLFKADEDGILFHSGQGKEMTAQLQRNPAAEICVFDPESNVQVRVSGAVEFLNDMALKQEVVAERPFLQPMVEQTGWDAFLLFRMTRCTATVWTMATNMEPKSFVSLSQ